MNRLGRLAIRLTERGLFADLVLRLGIRYLVKDRLQELQEDDPNAAAAKEIAFIDQMRGAPIALVPDMANQQHYEVPAEFFRQVLGPHLKYSSAYWPEGVTTLADAEAAGLRETCAHADLANGQTILELGCGWGSLSLWMAKHYPDSRITAVSNSHSQRLFIEATAKERGLRNLQVLTCDMNAFDSEHDRYDRVVSVEMFEHMRNWPALFERVHGWLRPQGLFFMHIFVHRARSYLFEDRGPSDWMSRYFFSGGMMPSDSLPLAFQEHLSLINHWHWDGTHYEKTANAWLARMDEARDTLWPLFEQVYSKAEARVWWTRWRIFFMACAELFGYEGGRQWGVSHYRFVKVDARA